MSWRRSDSSARLKLAITPAFFASSSHASVRLYPPDSATTRSTRGCRVSGRNRSGVAGSDSLSITGSLPGMVSSALVISSSRIASASARSALLMFTSGSRIGISPCASTWCATSNCCFTTAAIPARSARLTTERSLVPNTPSPFARSSSASRPGIGFISWTPSASVSSPLSILRNGTTPLSASAVGTGLPPASPSIVRSNRIAPITLSPVKAGEVMIRTRIWWIRSYIPSSSDHAFSAMP